MTADVIEQNLEGVTPVFVYGATLLEVGYRWTSEDEQIDPEEFYCVTPFGVFHID